MSFFRKRDSSAPDTPEPLNYEGREIPEEAVTRVPLTPGSINSAKIAEDVVESEKVDPSDPLYVHTLVKFALKKLGMSQEEADRYAAAHQQHAVDAYRATEK
jgi:acetyl-CoA acetyltransferase